MHKGDSLITQCLRFLCMAGEGCDCTRNTELLCNCFIWQDVELLWSLHWHVPSTGINIACCGNVSCLQGRVHVMLGPFELSVSPAKHVWEVRSSHSQNFWWLGDDPANDSILLPKRDACAQFRNWSFINWLRFSGFSNIAEFEAQ